MKNKLQDLNNHLFMVLERLNDEELTEEKLEMEIKRSESVSHVAAQIVSTAKIALDVTKLKLEYAPVRQIDSKDNPLGLPEILVGEKEKNASS